MERPQEVSYVLPVVPFVNPVLPRVLIQNDGHPFVDAGNHRIGLRRDHGECFNHPARRWLIQIGEVELAACGRLYPLLPESGHAEERLVLHGEPERRPDGSRQLPLIKSVGNDKASLEFKRLFEAGLF